MTQPNVVSITQTFAGTTASQDQIDTQTVTLMDNQLKAGADVQRRVYEFERRSIYNNRNYPKKDTDGNVIQDADGNPVTDSDRLYAIFEEKTRTGMMAAQLGEAAKIAKASYNRFEKRNPIVDPVPEALIIPDVDARDLNAEDIAAITAFATQKQAERLAASGHASSTLNTVGQQTESQTLAP